MNRRKFFGAVGSILAAPAIVRAESLMKLWVPNQILVPEMDVVPVFGEFERFSYYETGYLTPSIWYKQAIEQMKRDFDRDFLKQFKGMR